MTTLIIINIVMLVLAVVLLAGKGDKLIAGYNTASEHERQQVHIKRLRLVVAAIIVLVTIAVDFPFFIGQEDNATVHIVSVIAIMLITVTGVIVANTWCKKK